MPERMTAEKAHMATHLLQVEGHTFAALAGAVGVSQRSIGRFVKSIRSSVYISGYAPDKNGRLFVPVWRFGIGRPDAPRPGRTLTAAEQMQKTRRNKRNAK